MLPISVDQCGDLLATWLENSSGPKVAKELAKKIGYKDSALFGAEKKKMKIISELAIANTELAIHAANVVFEGENVNRIVDVFLERAKRSVFGYLEGKDPTFSERYERRMRDYFNILSGERPALGLSFLFIKSLNLDPLCNLEGQVFVAAHFGDTLSKTIDVLRRLTIQPVKT